MSGPRKKPLSLEEATQPIATQQSSDDQAWHDEQTRQAIKEADAGDFATAEELKATVRNFVPHG